MHNYEKEINEWREDLISLRGLEIEVVDELEDHLWNKLDEFRGLGLSKEDAFALAKIRLGHPASLCHEFEKLHGQSVRLKQVGYMIGGYLLIHMLLKFVEVASSIAVGVSLFATDTVRWISTTYIVTNILLFVLLGFGLLRLAQADSSLQSIEVFRRFNLAFRRYPFVPISVVLLVFVLTTFTSRIGLNMLMAISQTPTMLAEYYIQTSMYSMVASLVVPVALTAILIWVVRMNNRLNGQTP